MKKIILYGILSLILFNSTICVAGSRTAKGLSEIDKLAITAGAAQACNADRDKMTTYEMIVSRILVNPTRSEQAEQAVLTAYARKKLQTYQEQKSSPEIDCHEVLERFNNMPLFRSTVYRDGTLKLPDGKIIKPVRPVKFDEKPRPKQLMKSQSGK
ncbi:MAG: hypothetical protein IJY58_01055 [Alphaproteobacteria bacterium]|nr:hypothetical protein [Alphaproteobacteria bacterium]